MKLKDEVRPSPGPGSGARPKATAAESARLELLSADPANLAQIERYPDRRSAERERMLVHLQHRYGNRRLGRMIEIARAGAGPNRALGARASATGGAEEREDPRRIRTRLGEGRPLESETKGRMERVFGTSFSQVRIHTDAPAARLSNELNARAFTVGPHVAFGAGEYRPGTPVGDALIAHELAHVVQQQGAQAPAAGDRTPALESDADHSAARAVASLWGGGKASPGLFRDALPRLRSGITLQRCGKCKVKSGPTYTPSGTLKAKATGSKKHGTKKKESPEFKLSAAFVHDPANDFVAGCCEVRQFVMWTKAADIPNTPTFRPKSSFKANTWHEDRDDVDKRYGHRDGPHSECTDDNHYETAMGRRSCLKGSFYEGADLAIDASGAKTGEWKFKLIVIDTCNGNAQVGSTARLTVDW